MKSATINDVAEHARVSIKTVSRVLNREPTVRKSTREKVEQTMKELNYQPNSSGRRLASKRSYLIGLVYDNTNFNAGYINNIQNGALEACREDHYDLLLYPCVCNDPTLVNQLSELVMSHRVDGLLLTPPISDLPEVQVLMQRLETPNIIFSKHSHSETEWTVCTDDQNISAEMVRHLFRLGHQRIAFVKGDPTHSAVLSRYSGYVDGMHESGLKLVKSLVAQGNLSFESGIDCALKLLRAPQPPTAIFCANDQMAAGVIKVAHEMGRSIPGDLSIAGFDDMPLAGQIWPQLTTIRQPLRRMSRLAGSLLIRRLRGETPDDINQIVKSEIIFRNSTGPAPLITNAPNSNIERDARTQKSKE